MLACCCLNNWSGVIDTESFKCSNMLSSEGGNMSELLCWTCCVHEDIHVTSTRNVKLPTLLITAYERSLNHTYKWAQRYIQKCLRECPLRYSGRNILQSGGFSVEMNKLRQITYISLWFHFKGSRDLKRAVFTKEKGREEQAEKETEGFVCHSSC